MRLSPPESAPESEVGPGQGGEPEAPARGESGPEAKAPAKVRRRKAATIRSATLEGRRLYLSEDVHFRLRLYAYQRKVKLSEAAEELLDRALPKFSVERSA